MPEIIVSPVIQEDALGKQKTIGWDVHIAPEPVARYKSKKRAFIYAHERAALNGRRVIEKSIHKPKLDTEKM